MLSAAVEDGLVARNPASRALVPRQNGRRAQPVPLNVVARIEAELPDWLRGAVPLALGAGLRQAEATGLTIGRVDFLRRQLRVDRQLVGRTGDDRPVLVAPKTPSSNRTVPLADYVLGRLAAHLQRWPGGPNDLVLRTPAGGPIDPSRFGYRWSRACVAAEVPDVRFHDLRHTYAATLLSKGVNVKAVASWLGHASPVTTLQTYSHLMPADGDVARRVIDEAFADPTEDSLRTVEQPSAD
jgi:integrase